MRANDKVINVDDFKKGNIIQENLLLKVVKSFANTSNTSNSTNATNGSNNSNCSNGSNCSCQFTIHSFNGYLLLFALSVVLFI